MRSLICILGRQPAISVAELESVFGPEAIVPFNDNSVIVNTEKKVSLQELGGTIKIAEIIGTIQNSSWPRVSSNISNKIVNYSSNRWKDNGHKLSMAISVYGFNIPNDQIRRLSFNTKKFLKEKGQSAHMTLPKDEALNSAQVIHNKLLGEFGAEFLIVTDSIKTILAKTLSVQDIDRYSKRDYERPGRDIKVGMLPPKLAQIMLNLAGVTSETKVLDPFCGTGVVLMEAALKHASIMGSDARQEMVSATKDNLKWLSNEYHLEINSRGITSADATSNKWIGKPDSVVTEMYLGPAMTKLPEEEQLKEIVGQCNNLLRKFLINLKPQLRPGARCCIAIPAWNTPKGLVRLPVADQVGTMGYVKHKFENLKSERIVYRRPDQLVARELLVLTAK
ncbi:MAG: hypothetical protein KGH60_01190 [Candidatus Micrarchaeota archaeon]|nr:hypothetical protein [Candidatus Micrarchaeota archaeon]